MSPRYPLACALVLALLCAPLLPSCTVDTQLGVAGTIQSATVTVNGTDPNASVAVQFNAEFRVGEHTQGARTFEVRTVDIFVGERAIATVNLDRPVGFGGTLRPGASQVVSYMGQSPAGAFATAQTDLCAGGVVAELLIRWEDVTASELGMANFTTMSVLCL